MRLGPDRSFVPRETVARRSLTQQCEQAPCRWEVDFSAALAFGGIDSVDFSLEVADGFPTAALRPRDPEAPLLVVVETKEKVTGKLVVTARQGGVEACGGGGGH